MTDDIRPATQDELEKARKAAERAAAKVAELEAAEAVKLDAEAAKRLERTQEYDKGFYSRWRDVAADANESEGSTAVPDYDPATMGFLEVLIRQVAVEQKRVYVRNHARRAESTLGVPSNQSVVPDDRYRAVDIVEHINALIGREAGRRAKKFNDALEAEREKFINGE
ncbi:hypothetical protein [Streptomyces sp. NPDC046939]|uniref:hypothetical protein n=1 Tax=Streptomyces sp. NPDC046939 TaxID=3155376 RepID=UPI0033D3FE8A